MTKLERQTKTARKYRASWQQTDIDCRSFRQSISLVCLYILGAIGVMILLYLGHRDVYNSINFQHKNNDSGRLRQHASTKENPIPMARRRKRQRLRMMRHGSCIHGIRRGDT